MGETSFDLSRITAWFTDMKEAITVVMSSIADFVSKLDIEQHPNKHVVHLACYGKKPRTRKKNLNRIKKWLTKN